MSFSLASFWFFLYKQCKRKQQQKHPNSSSLQQTSGKRHRKHLETPSPRPVWSHTDTDTNTQTWHVPSLGPAHEPLQPVQSRLMHVTHTSLADAQESTRAFHTRDCDGAYIRRWDVHHTDGYAAWQTCTWGKRSVSSVHSDKRHWKEEYLSAYPQLCSCFVF